MNTKLLLISIRFALVVVAGFGVSSLRAQDATATLADVQNGSTFSYTLTLRNTGTIPLEGLWYAWTTLGNNLPSIPTNPGNSLGWANTVVTNSIQYQGNAGDALAPNSSAIFTFDSTSTPAQITTPPSGESVAYAGAIHFTQNVPGDSSPVFSPALVAVPEPSIFGLFAIGLAGCSAAASRRVRGLANRLPLIYRRV